MSATADVRPFPSPVARAALDYARMGWHVFPCRRGDKRPLTAHGLHDATDDPAKVEAFWRRYPDAMIGVRTGPESGLWVLDADTDAERGLDGPGLLAEREREAGALPTTIRSMTPRGGCHLFFRWCDGIRNSAGKAGPGIDVRGAGGYVIVPPSLRSDGVGYAWEAPPGLFSLEDAPAWLLDLVRGAFRELPEDHHDRARAPDRYVEAALDGECRAVVQSPKGKRNDRLNEAAFSLGQIVGAGALSEDRVRARLLDAATACGLLADDGLKAVKNTIRSGLEDGRAKPRDLPREDSRSERSSHDRSPDPPEPETKPEIAAKPFAWCDPRSIPLRAWIYGRHYIRKFVSVTVAPGGVGKSSLAIAEALAMVSGKELLGESPAQRSKVWLWNGEDPEEELQRRVMATALHYELEPADLDGWLFVGSGRDCEIVLAEQDRSGIKIAVPVVDALKATIRANGIDVVVIDPFISSHRVGENDNGAIDRVAKLWARIADETGCAVELIHHARKTNGAEVSMEDGRGAVALLAAARSGRVLNVMTKDEAERFGVDRPRLHFRVDNGKANLAPPPEGASWFKLVSVPLGNGPLQTDGDSVGVVAQWKLPDPLDDVSVSDLRTAQKAVSHGRWRENIQAADWVGKPVAQALGFDLNNPVHKEKVKRLIKIWIAAGMFVVVTGKDDKGTDRPFVEVGEWAND